MPICVLRAATGPVHAYSPNWRDRRGGRRFYPFCGHELWPSRAGFRERQDSPQVIDGQVIRQHLDWLRV
ncbi:hypothetical protein CYMTET_3182 [Cymbomonas tetramitiformis]|uniref:Uncharacterized protein n=1 Tax=Cymbomonas tetramitiformis TaxID=36881 RepID=A0AAE0FQG4_9CHLO|nr:hypothetical protein CYMTET_27093 [Cymbomonas tetramitiformis]KAK3289382.1 hypothetical protein CYMTET_3182 [Cymbomonas tetramitiformis]